MLEVEGGTPEWCLRILRHEAGHAIDNAYRLQRRRRRQELFGSSSEPYPEDYTPRPYSRSFVVHLESWYAQSHPSEDFAETFAVWLTPDSQWRARYAGWPALRKLEYMDELMRDDRPARSGRRAQASRWIRSRASAARCARTTSASGAKYGVEYPNFYDRDLRRLFSDKPEHASNVTAAVFLSRIRKDVRRRVARFTGEKQYTIDQVIENIIRRSRGTRPAPRRPGRSGADGLHGPADGADRERPAQRQAQAGPMKTRSGSLALMHDYLVPPDDTDGVDVVNVPWKMEFDVVSHLEDMGHQVRKVGVKDDLGVIRQAILDFKPQIVFNLMESFDEIGVFDQHVVSYLELMKTPYTGCNPRGLMLSRDKALARTLLAYHRIPGARVRRRPDGAGAPPAEAAARSRSSSSR